LYTLAAEFIVRGNAWVRKIEYGAAGSDWKKWLSPAICLRVKLHAADWHILIFFKRPATCTGTPWWICVADFWYPCPDFL